MRKQLIIKFFKKIQIKLINRINTSILTLNYIFVKLIAYAPALSTKIITKSHVFYLLSLRLSVLWGCSSNKLIDLTDWLIDDVSQVPDLAAVSSHWDIHRRSVPATCQHSIRHETVPRGPEKTTRHHGSRSVLHVLQHRQRAVWTCHQGPSGSHSTAAVRR